MQAIPNLTPAFPPTPASGAGRPPMQAIPYPTPVPPGQSPVITPMRASGAATPQFMSGPPSGAFFGQQVMPPLAPAPPELTSPSSGPGRRRRGLAALLTILILLVLLGAGAGSYFTFFRHNAPVASVGGQVFFVSSGQFNPNSAQGIADELEFSLHNLPAPQPGNGYYAWLLADRHPQAEAVPLEPQPQFTLPLQIGPLPFSNGSINYLYPGTSAHDNLFSLASRLLITEESTSGKQLGPAATQSTWRYYAEIPQTLYGSNPALSALDHIRHLFYKETKVAVLGLPGGLDVWLFRNTEKIMEWSVSARDDYSATSPPISLLHGLFTNILTDLDSSNNVSIDVPGGIKNLDPTLRVALLSVIPAQQNGTDLNNNPPGYVDHFALHLNGIVQAPDATPAMRALGAQMIEALNNAKTWLQQVRTYAQQLEAMNITQLGQPATLTLLDNMLQNATYAYVGQLDPKTDQVIPAVLKVHYDVQKLAVLTVSGNLPTSI